MKFLGCVKKTGPLISLFVGMTLASAGQTNNDPTKLAQNLIKQHEAWLYNLSTPGASIRGRQTTSSDSTFRYNLYVTGLPDDRLYDVVSWPINEEHPSTIFSGVSLGKDGVVMCSGHLPGECNDPSPDDHGRVAFVFSVDSGEPVRLALISGAQRASGVIVPNPIAGTDHGCSLFVQRLTPHFEVAYITGAGYPAGSQVTFVVTSYNETHSINANTNNDGALHFAMLPFVLGHHEGTTRIQASGIKQCAPSVQFKWGD